MEYAKITGKRTGDTYYLTVIKNSNGLNTKAYRGATTPFEPLRQIVGAASFYIYGKDVLSANSTVEENCRREGLLEAMYDLVETEGWSVHPADGSVGPYEVQAQSDDAKAFWKTRKKRTTKAALLPCTEDEFHGWDNPYWDAAEVLGRPVHEQIKIAGEKYPMLVLWGHRYTNNEQRVGVIYGRERGYQGAVMIRQAGRHDEEDAPWFDGTALRFRNSGVSTRIMDKTYKELLGLCREIKSRS